MTEDRNAQSGFGKLVHGAAQFGVIVAMVLLLKTVAAEAYYVPSGSMLPSLLVGDYLLVSKFPYGYSRHSLPLPLDSTPTLPPIRSTDFLTMARPIPVPSYFCSESTFSKIPKITRALARKFQRGLCSSGLPEPERRCFPVQSPVKLASRSFR